MPGNYDDRADNRQAGFRKGHPIFAALYDRWTAGAEQAGLAALRAETVSRATGEVIEVGAGTGANFAYYRPERVERVAAVEPDLHMRQRAERKAATALVPVILASEVAERLSFAAGSFDSAIVILTF